MALWITAFDGNTLNSTSAYRAVLPYGSSAPKASTPSLVERRSSHPLHTGTTLNAWRFPLRISGVAGAGVTYAQFRENVEEWFSPLLSGATRTMTATWHDGTAVQIEILVESLELVSDAGAIQTVAFVASCIAPYPVWESTSLTTSASNPATVTNAGNTRALPTLELTTTTHVTRRACTVTGAGSGGGLIAYPVVFALDDANATSANTFVFVEGLSVPCYVDNSGASNSRVWALVDTDSDNTTATRVDVIYNGPANPLCQTLPDGGMSWGSGGNTSWVWGNFPDVLTAPRRPGAWYPGVLGMHNAASAATYRLTVTGGTTAVATLGTGLSNNADSIRMLVGARAGTATALTNLSRQTATLDGINARAFVRYRLPGEQGWTDAWTSRANATVSTSIDLDNACEIAAGIENDGATLDPSTLSLSGGSITLALIGYPTVVVGSAENLDWYDGVVAVGSRSITLVDLMVPDGTLTINCGTSGGERAISSSVAGPFYWPDGSDVQPYEFSEPDQWFVLETGSNAASNGAGGSLVVKFRDSFS